MTLQTTLYLLIAVLLGGTVFAWVNFVLTTLEHCNSCSIGPKGKPSIKCLLGAIFFTVALVLAIYAVTLI